VRVAVAFLMFDITDKLIAMGGDDRRACALSGAVMERANA
jgi:hypothetical protein